MESSQRLRRAGRPAKGPTNNLPAELYAAYAGSEGRMLLILLAMRSVDLRSGEFLQGCCESRQLVSCCANVNLIRHVCRRRTERKEAEVESSASLY